MHDRLLAALQKIAQVSLVAALRDDRLGFPDPKDLRVFIPDLHLISAQRQATGGFHFSTNHESLLVTLLGVLKSLKLAAAADERVRVAQLGDILDLWREVPHIDPQEETAARIANDHAELMNALRDPDLNATLFLGNHDYELYHWASYARCVRKLFIPAGDPQVLVLHGDVFDWIERFPDAVKEFLVYYFAAGTKPTNYALGQMYQFVRQASPNPNDPAAIHCSTPARLNGLQPVAGGAIPARFNLQRAGNAAANTTFLDMAYDAVGRPDNAYGFPVKTVIIGHTHQARIAVREENGGLFTLIDCGSWIENCSVDGATNPLPSAQICALCGNEARIYQLAPLPAVAARIRRRRATGRRPARRRTIRRPKARGRTTRRREARAA
jgi:UDP-2,3-diacylglucosamine pyrophosphatase LpxH